MENIQNFKRTDMCGDLRLSDEGRRVIVMGWVQRRRDLGSLIFVWLRDRSGIVQLAFNPDTDKALFDNAQMTYIIIAP